MDLKPQHDWAKTKALTLFVLTAGSICSAPTNPMTAPYADMRSDTTTHATPPSLFLPIIAPPALPPMATEPFPVTKSKLVHCDQSKYSSIVIDALTGQIIFGENEHKKLHPASLVKLMTAYLVFQQIELGNLNMDDQLIADNNKDYRTWRNLNVLGVKAKDRFTVEDALKGIVTWSAADATDILATRISGSVPNFAKLMNETGKNLGLKDTNFINASGFTEDKQKSSAYDMALLMLTLLKHFPEQCAIFQTLGFDYKGVHYTNHALIKGSPSDMGKTGYVDDSRFNTALTFPYKDHRVIIVVMGGKTQRDRDQHVIDLYNATKTYFDRDRTVIMPQKYNTRYFSNLPIKEDFRRLGIEATINTKRTSDLFVEPIKRRKEFLDSLKPFENKFKRPVLVN